MAASRSSGFSETAFTASGRQARSRGGARVRGQADTETEEQQSEDQRFWHACLKNLPSSERTKRMRSGAPARGKPSLGAPVGFCEAVQKTRCAENVSRFRRIVCATNFFSGSV